MMSGTKRKIFLHAVLPVLCGFVVMGAVDVAGVARNYLQQDFGLTEQVAGLIPAACYLWFLFFGIPAGAASARFGKRRIAEWSMAAGAAALVIPFIFKGSLTAALSALAALGIASTFLMVAVNPLAKDAAGERQTAGILSIGSSLKALTSIAVPLLMALSAETSSGWQGGLLVLAAASAGGAVLMHFSEIEESPCDQMPAKSVFRLLARPEMAACFICAMFIVGIDAGVISYLPMIFRMKGGMELDGSVALSSLYPATKMAAAFLGGLLLLKLRTSTYTKASIVLMLAGIVCWLSSASSLGVMVGTIMFGCGYANMFSILYAAAMNLFPDRENEVSSLMIMSLAGGAAMGPLIGLLLG